VRIHSRRQIETCLLLTQQIRQPPLRETERLQRVATERIGERLRQRSARPDPGQQLGRLQHV